MIVVILPIICCFMCSVGIFWLLKYSLHIVFFHQIGLLEKGSLICLFFDTVLIFYGLFRLMLFRPFTGYYDSYMGGYMVSESVAARWSLTETIIGIVFSLFCILLCFLGYKARQYGIRPKGKPSETSPHILITLLLVFISLIMLPISFIIWIATMNATQLITGG